MSAAARAILVFVSTSCVVFDAVTYASSKYLGIEPGWSTRAEADKVLGVPVVTLGDRLFEYTPQEGTGPIFVEVRRGADAIVDRVEVAFVGFVERAPLLEALQLPGDPLVAAVGANGILLEYFGNNASMVLTYKGAHRGSGVVSLGHYSDRFFEVHVDRAKARLASGEAKAPTAPPTTDTPTPPGPQTGPGPTTPPAGPSPIPPSMKRDHLACYDLYLWSDAEAETARRARQIPRRQLAMNIRIAAQSGDCGRARSLTDAYKKQFAGKD